LNFINFLILAFDPIFPTLIEYNDVLYLNDVESSEPGNICFEMSYLLISVFVLEITYSQCVKNKIYDIALE